VLLQDAIRDYALFLKNEQRATKTTIRTYLPYLNTFATWMATNVRPDPTLQDLSTPALRRYYYGLCERNLRPRTLRGRLRPIQSLCKFLLTNGALKEDPTKDLTIPKKDIAVRLLVSQQEVQSLVAGVERIAGTRRVCLARAVLLVLVCSGVRRQELVDLRTSDYDGANSLLRVKCGKGGKARDIYLPDSAVQALDEWLRVRPTSKLDWLWLFDYGRRMGHNALRTLIEEIKCAAGLRGATNIKPHSLRHYYASNLVRNGADLESVRKLLGHSSLTITQIYVHADEQTLKNVAKLADVTPATPPKPEQADRPGPRAASSSREERPRRRIAR
jgi:site-specific recombinase XerD